MMRTQVCRVPGRFGGSKRQAGATLIEIMIGLALSMVVTSSMVILMANSLGSATRIIQMSQLTDELRNAMSMMSRDVRRANFNPNAIYCYANSDCGADGSATQSADIFVSDDNQCFIFNLDRNWDGDASTDAAGAFRRREIDEVGVVEMWVGGASPNCGDTTDNPNWIAVTNPEFIDITAEFSVGRDGSFDGTVESGGGTLTQTTRLIHIRIPGELLIDRSIRRQIEDTIKVRNDVYM